MDKIKIYSPNQVSAAAFFGGPFAAVYVLLSNFRALGNDAGARYTRLGGALFIAAVLLTIPFLPDRFPNYAIPAAYMIVARMIADKYQMTKQAIQNSEQHEFQSNWTVFGISVGFLIAFFLVAVAWLFALDAINVIRL